LTGPFNTQHAPSATRRVYLCQGACPSEASAMHFAVEAQSAGERTLERTHGHWPRLLTPVVGAL